MLNNRSLSPSNASRSGTGASFGTQTGFVTREDLRDAKAVIEWAAGQDFSTGAVGAMGCSNQGVWQYGVTALKPVGLKAIAPACASPAFFDDAVTLNGVPMFELRKAPYDATCPEAGGSGPASAARPVDSDVDGAMLREALATRGCTAPMLGQYWLNMPRDGWNAFGVYRPAIEDSMSRAASAAPSSWAYASRTSSAAVRIPGSESTR